jgi:hypothetical protein
MLCPYNDNPMNMVDLHRERVEGDPREMVGDRAPASMRGAARLRQYDGAVHHLTEGGGTIGRADGDQARVVRLIVEPAQTHRTAAMSHEGSIARLVPTRDPPDSPNAANPQ